MKQKVMFFLQFLEGGGAEKVAIDILNSIDKEKYDVTLLLLFGKGLYIDRLSPEIKVKVIFNKSYDKIIDKFIFTFIKYFPRIFYKLVIPKNFQIEVAFLEGFATKVISYSTNIKSKKIAWIHTDLSKYRWTNYAYRKDEEFNCYKRFNDIICVSKDALIGFDSIFCIDNVKRHVVYNPIIIESILNQSTEKEVIYDDFTIISVGRLINIKGYDRLIRAHAKVVKNYPHHLIIIGEGGERKSLEELINLLDVNETVILMGFIGNPYPYVRAADLFVSSSIAEGFSLALLEAIILERPVMITEASGTVEVLGGDSYGVICENSQEGLEEDLEYILKNRWILEYYKERSRERREFFQYQNTIKEIEKIFDEKIINK